MFVATHSQRTLATLLRLACICAFLPMAACSYGGGSSGGGGAAPAGAVVEEEPPEVQVARLVWGPADGPVAAYDIEISRNGGAFALEQTAPTQIFDVEGEVGETFRIRVRAVAASGERGPASDPSDEIIFTEDGPALVQASTEPTAPSASTASLPEPTAPASADDAQVGPETVSSPMVRGDVNGDGAADLLWASPSSIMATRLAGGALDTVSEIAAPEGWDVAGFGDFDGDGGVDLLWTATDGALAYSALAEVSTGLVALGVLEADETVVAVGDFDGNGTSDLIVSAGDGSHAWWKVDPEDEGLSIFVLDQPDAASTLAASGDFDGDATDDLLWQAADGSLHADFLSNGEVDAILVVSNGGDAALGAGDFTGDGVADVLIRDAAGTLGVLAMGERAEPTLLSGPIDAGAEWDVEGVADYDGNGVADVLWAQGGSLVLRLDGDPVDLPIDAGSDWMLVPAGL